MSEASGGVELLAVANMLRWIPEEPIGAFRRRYYPTAQLIGPHLTLVYPLPAAIGLAAFTDHVRSVVSRTPAFELHLRGLDVTWDHWLYLDLAEGRDEVVALHDALYTGIAAPHRWTDRPYVPHVGLGAFSRDDDQDDLLERRPRELDLERFESASAEASALGLDHRGVFDEVDILGVDEALTHVTSLERIALASGER